MAKRRAPGICSSSTQSKRAGLPPSIRSPWRPRASTPCSACPTPDSGAQARRTAPQRHTKPPAASFDAAGVSLLQNLVTERLTRLQHVLNAGQRVLGLAQIDKRLALQIKHLLLAQGHG